MGIVLEFDNTTNSGIVSGEDGNRYQFSRADWKESTPPIKGDNIDFAVSGEGRAIEIYQNPYATNTNSAHIAQHLSNNSTAINAEENYSIIDWFKKCLRNYANFSGRARRKEYWYFVLIQSVLAFIATIIDYIIFSNLGLFYFVTALGLFIPSLAVTIRRLHDTSRSGWWMLISIIPLIGSILLIVWLATETKPEVNQWGPPAK